MTKKKTPPKSEFSQINLLSVGIAVALFIRRSDYADAMHDIGIREENWHAWPDDCNAWVATYKDGENYAGKHIVCCLGGTVGKDGIEIAATLCHEATHIWQEYARHIGERHPGDEQEAYAIAAISEFLMREFVRQGGIEKKKSDVKSMKKSKDSHT